MTDYDINCLLSIYIIGGLFTSYAWSEIIIVDLYEYDPKGNNDSILMAGILWPIVIIIIPLALLICWFDEIKYKN